MTKSAVASNEELRTSTSFAVCNTHRNLNFTGILLLKEFVESQSADFFKLLTLLPFPMDSEELTPLFHYPSYIPKTDSNFKIKNKNFWPGNIMHRLQTDAFPKGQQNLSCLISEWVLGHFLKDSHEGGDWTRVVMISAYGHENVNFFNQVPLLSVVNFCDVHLKPDPMVEKRWLWRVHEPKNGVCSCTKVDWRSDFAKTVYETVHKMVKGFEAKEDVKKEEAESIRSETDFSDVAGNNDCSKNNKDNYKDDQKRETAFRFSEMDEYYYDPNDYRDRFEDSDDDEKVLKDSDDPLMSFLVRPEKSNMFYRESDIFSNKNSVNTNGGTPNPVFPLGFVDDVYVIDHHEDPNEEDLIYQNKDIVPLKYCRQPTRLLLEQKQKNAFSNGCILPLSNRLEINSRIEEVGSFTEVAAILEGVPTTTREGLFFRIDARLVDFQFWLGKQQQNQPSCPEEKFDGNDPFLFIELQDRPQQQCQQSLLTQTIWIVVDREQAERILDRKVCSISKEEVAKVLGAFFRHYCPVGKRQKQQQKEQQKQQQKKQTIRKARKRKSTDDEEEEWTTTLINFEDDCLMKKEMEKEKEEVISENELVDWILEARQNCQLNENGEPKFSFSSENAPHSILNRHLFDFADSQMNDDDFTQWILYLCGMYSYSANY